MKIKKERKSTSTATVRRRGLMIVQLVFLPLPEMEEAIVEIWKCVEEYQMPSPKLKFDFQGDTAASMALHVEDRVSFAILSARLSNWIMARGSDWQAAIGESQSAHAPALSAQLTCGEISVSGLSAPVHPPSGFRRA
jgi:hypothetical protein